MLNTNTAHLRAYYRTRMICRLCVSLMISGSFAFAEDPPPKIPNVVVESTLEKLPEASAGESAANSSTSISPRITRYALHLLLKYDRNRDGLLQQDEWRSMHGHPESIDQNGDSLIGVDELSFWIRDYGQQRRIGVPWGIDSNAPSPKNAEHSVPDADHSAVANEQDATIGKRRRDLKFFVPEKRLPAGLPDWFVSRDADGDGQLTAAEFSPSASSAELADFAKYDANGDGIVTAKECVSRGSDKPTATIKNSNDLPESGHAPAKTSRGRRKVQPSA